MDTLSDISTPSDKIGVEGIQLTDEERGLAVVAEARDDVRRILARMSRRKGITKRETSSLSELHIALMVVAGLVERQLIARQREAM